MKKRQLIVCYSREYIRLHSCRTKKGHEFSILSL